MSGSWLSATTSAFFGAWATADPAVVRIASVVRVAPSRAVLRMTVSLRAPRVGGRIRSPQAPTVALDGHRRPWMARPGGRPADHSSPSGVGQDLGRRPRPRRARAEPRAASRHAELGRDLLDLAPGLVLDGDPLGRAPGL